MWHDDDEEQWFPPGPLEGLGWDLLYALLAALASVLLLVLLLVAADRLLS